MGPSSGAGLVELREVREADLPIFFRQALDPKARWMAAFAPPEVPTREAFEEQWRSMLRDPARRFRTILVDGQTAGYLARFEMFGKPSVAYWLGEEFWGKGVATAALGAFLREVEQRPLFARAAADNIGSVRVLTKCGFRPQGRLRSFAGARGEEVEEVLFALGTDAAPRERARTATSGPPRRPRPRGPRPS